MAPYGTSSDYGSGSYMGSGSFVTATTTYSPYPTGHTHTVSGSAIGGYPTPAQQKQIDAQNKKVRDEMERQRKKAWDTWHMGKLSDWKKLKIMKIANDLLKQYHREQGVKQIMQGLKWFLFFLGLAVLLNFKPLIDLIRFAIKH